MHKLNIMYPVAALVILIVGGSLYMVSAQKTAAPTKEGTNPTLGTYQYECDEHVKFSMTPSADMNSIHIKPSLSGVYPPESTLVKQASSSDVLYVGNGVALTARGETVTLGDGDSAIYCSPVQDPNLAPLNFGD